MEQSTSFHWIGTLRTTYTVINNTTFKSNTKLLFQGGVYYLNVVLNVNNCHSFTMAGNGSAIRYSNNPPQPKLPLLVAAMKHQVMVECFSQSAVMFTSTIYNLTLAVQCSYRTERHHTYIFASALIFKLVQNVSLKEVLFNNTKGIGRYTCNIFGEYNELDSAFLHLTYRVHSDLMRMEMQTLL